MPLILYRSTSERVHQLNDNFAVKSMGVCVRALKVGNLLSAEADAELSPGHAREPLIDRGHGPLLRVHGLKTGTRGKNR